MAHRKQDSVRRWKARYFAGKWIPWSVWNNKLINRVPYNANTHQLHSDINLNLMRLLNPARL